MTASLRPAPGLSRNYTFPKFERYALANGVSIVLAPVHKAPLVSLLAVIDAGAVNEPEAREGLAQLTAEALREGTTGRSGVELVDAFEKLGTSLEAGADWDSTIASLTVATDRLETAFALFAEVLLAPTFPEDQIGRLRGEALAERLQVMSEPRTLAEEGFSRFLYPPASRYSEPLTGSARTIRELSRSHVEEFFKACYAPESLIIILAGDLLPADGLRLADRYFGSFSGQGATQIRATAVSPGKSNRSMLIAKEDAVQSELRIGHAGVPRSHPDYFGIIVMNALLGGLFSSRINLNLREAHGYTYGASSYFDWRRGTGPFVVSSAVQTEATAASAREVIREIDRMRTELVGEEELSLATSYLEGVFPIRYETTSAIAAALASLVVFGLPEDYYDTYRSHILAVSQDDVLRAARNHVRPEELQLVVVGAEATVRQQLEELALGPLEVRAPET